MLITKPAYFDTFRCIASACPDSCCKEWDVQVDEASAAFYRSLPGALGDRLREVLHTEDGQTVMTIIDGRCPMWREDGLCRIQAEQGEEALCHTCREFPRLTHDYGDFVEKGLELSCPEAARIILSSPVMPRLEEEISGGEEPEYDVEAMEVLKRTRETVLALVMDPAYSVPEMLALVLLYGYQAQGELDGEEAAPFSPEAGLQTLHELAKEGSIQAVLTFFRELEILTQQWERRLLAWRMPVWDPRIRNLMAYFVERYWLQAVSDYDLACRVKFMVISALVISSLDGDFVETAQMYSKEVENSTDNLETILDGAYSHPAFTDDRLLGLLGFGES